MVVGTVQMQNIKAMPKKQEIPMSDGKKSFERLMNERTRQDDTEKAPSTQEKFPKDEVQDLEKPREKPQEKDNKSDISTQDAASLAVQATQPTILDVVAPTPVAAVPTEQINIQQIAQQIPQQVENLQLDGAIKAAEEIIVPQEKPKSQSTTDKVEINLSQENGKEQAVQPQMKIPFEKVLEAGQDVKIPVVNTAAKADSVQNGTQLNDSTDVNKTQTPVYTQEKKVTAEEAVNVMPQQQRVQTLNPDNINIKVGEAVDTKSEVFAEDFADKVVFKINQDIKEFQIELNPQDMGKVFIKVVFAAEKAFVSMSCENAKTQSLLAQSSDTIRSIIQQNVGSETVVVVQEQQQQQNYQQKQQQEQQQAQDNQNKSRQKPSDDSLTFVNQLRLGLVDVNDKL